MKMKNIGIAAKYTMIVLAGCAAVTVAAESLSSGGKNDVPVLKASHSTTSSPEHSTKITSVSTPPSSDPTSVSSSAALPSSTQSSTSVLSPVVSEPPEPPISVNEPPEDIHDSSAPQSVPTESTSEQPPASTSSKSFWELTDEEWEKYLQNASGVIQSFDFSYSSSMSDSSSTSSASTNEPPVSSSVEPPLQSSKPPVSSIEPSESVSPDIPGFVIVNINTATVNELIQLDGIGEEKALAIIEFREKFGGFTSIYEIREVDGIGDSTFERIRDFIVI